MSRLPLQPGITIGKVKTGRYRHAYKFFGRKSL